MHIFTYDPASEESLRDFNERLGTFCEERLVLNIESRTFGKRLVVTITEVDDVPTMPGTPLVTATVRQLTPDTGVEEYVNSVIEKIEEMNPSEPNDDEGETVPFSTQIVERSDKSGYGYVIVVCMLGIYTGEEDDENDGDDEEEPIQGPGGDHYVVEPERVEAGQDVD
jgi:hypothetical protein